MSNAILRQQAQTIGKQRSNTHRLELLWALLPALAAVAIGWSATAAGPGINADSVNYINAAANFLAGRGFVADFVSPYNELPYGPITFWPPGFSLLIAGVGALGMNAVEAARWVSLLALGGVVYCAYWLGRVLCSASTNRDRSQLEERTSVHSPLHHRIDERLCGLLAAMATACLMPVVRLGTFALSEAPFMLFSMLALLAAIQFARHDGIYQERNWLLLCTLWVALAILTRYVGIIWLVALAGVILWKGRAQATPWLRTAATIVASCALAAAPLLPWLYRNWRLTGHLTGMERTNKYHAEFMENLVFLTNVVVDDLIPPMHLGVRELAMDTPKALLVVGALVLLVLVGGGLIWLVRTHAPGALAKWRWDGIWRLLCTGKALAIQFCALYVAWMLLVSTIMEFPPYDWPRAVAVIYPTLVAVLLSLFVAALHWVWQLRLLRPFGFLQMPILLVVVALCIAPHALRTCGFVQEAAKGQEFTAPAWRNNQALQEVARTVDAQNVLYSDRAPAAYLYLQRPVRYLPYREEAATFYQLLERKSAQLGDSVFVLTFKGELGSNDPYRSSRISYAEMVELAAANSTVQLVADLPDGAIFQLSSARD